MKCGIKSDPGQNARYSNPGYDKTVSKEVTEDNQLENRLRVRLISNFADQTGISLFFISNILANIDSAADSVQID